MERGPWRACVTIPTLVGVNQLNAPDVMAFAGGLSEPLSPEPLSPDPQSVFKPRYCTAEQVPPAPSTMEGMRRRSSSLSIRNRCVSKVRHATAAPRFSVARSS